MRSWIVLAIALLAAAPGVAAEVASLGGATGPMAEVVTGPDAANNLVAPEAARGNPLWEISLDSLRETRERPLFAPSRRPPPSAAQPEPVVAAAPPPPAAAPDPPPFQLVGTLLGGKANLAILRNVGNQTTIKLWEGDSTSGWRAQKVSARQAVFEKDGAAFTLQLLPPSASTAPNASSDGLAAATDDSDDNSPRSRRRK